MELLSRTQDILMTSQGQSIMRISQSRRILDAAILWSTWTMWNYHQLEVTQKISYSWHVIQTVLSHQYPNWLLSRPCTTLSLDTLLKLQELKWELPAQPQLFHLVLVKHFYQSIPTYMQRCWLRELKNTSAMCGLSTPDGQEVNMVLENVWAWRWLVKSWILFTQAF